MKGIIIYSTKHEALKKYIEWVCINTKLDALTVEQVDKYIFDDIDFFIFAGTELSKKFYYKKFMKKNNKKLVAKKMYIFSILEPSEERKILQDKINKQIPKELHSRIRCYAINCDTVPEWFHEVEEPFFINILGTHEQYEPIKKLDVLNTLITEIKYFL